MIRYLALAWNSADPAKSNVAAEFHRRLHSLQPRWQTAVHRDGFAVWYRRSGPTPDDAYVIHRDQGVVLGTLFERSYAAGSVPARVILDDDAIVQTAGRELLKRYWGRYVAFVHDSHSRRTLAMRDPTGSIHCFRTRLSGVDVCFCRLEDCERLERIEGSINWPYIESQLRFRTVDDGTTGLDEISQVLPGECIEIGGEARSRTFHWNPFDLVASGSIEDPLEAARATRDCVRACVHAWASCWDGILHHLSGGLDSSIIASCLADTPNAARVTYLNEYSPGSNTDERYFARLVARSTGAELVERLRNPSFDFTHLRQMPRTPFPCSCFSHFETARADAALAESRGASVGFTGIGGDWLFLRRGALPSAVDYAYRHGVAGGLFHCVLDAAALMRRSAWSVTHDTIRYGLLRRPWNVRTLFERDDCGLVNPEVMRAAQARDAHIHPLYREPRAVAPGKLYHSYLISAATLSYYNPFARDEDPALISPLCSQPLMELSLKIPVDVLTVGGVDRAIARMAFSQDLPPEIAARRSKGGLEEHAKAALFKNIGLVRELLLDGLLVARGYIDRAGLERALSRQPTRTRSSVSDIYQYLTLEGWCRSSARRAAA